MHQESLFFSHRVPLIPSPIAPSRAAEPGAFSYLVLGRTLFEEWDCYFGPCFPIRGDVRVITRDEIDHCLVIFCLFRMHSSARVWPTIAQLCRESGLTASQIRTAIEILSDADYFGLNLRLAAIEGGEYVGEGCAIGKGFQPEEGEPIAIPHSLIADPSLRPAVKCKAIEALALGWTFRGRDKDGAVIVQL